MTAASERGELGRALAHDVGKYLARASRNLPATGAIPKVLVDMLARDLYAPLPSGKTPRERLVELEDALRRLGVEDARLDGASGHMNTLLDLADGVRRGDVATVRSAARLALEVERMLADLARELSSAGRAAP